MAARIISLKTVRIFSAAGLLVVPGYQHKDHLGWCREGQALFDRRSKTAKAYVSPARVNEQGQWHSHLLLDGRKRKGFALEPTTSTFFRELFPDKRQRSFQREVSLCDIGNVDTPTQGLPLLLYYASCGHDGYAA